MTAYLPGPRRRIYKVRLEVAPGVWVARSTGTADRRLAGRIHAMCRDLGGRGARAWDLLAYVQRTEWSLMELWERWQHHGGDVAAMRAAVADAPLAALVEPFLAAVQKDASADTVQHYRVYLAHLQANGFTRLTDLTVPALSGWLERLHGSAGTRRKYAAGVSAFCAWLVRRGHLAGNPMRDVRKPRPGEPRMSFVETADAQRIADAQPEPFRSLSALLAGTGLDLSVALGLTRQQVDLTTWGIVSRRAKTRTPHTLLVAQWARPALERLCAGKLPGALLFAGVTRYQASQAHRAACAALGIHGYWLRDARHTWAVRHFKAGGTAAQAAEQLGHRDGGVLALSVYGRYVPSLAERAVVEGRASAAERGA